MEGEGSSKSAFFKKPPTPNCLSMSAPRVLLVGAVAGAVYVPYGIYLALTGSTINVPKEFWITQKAMLAGFDVDQLVLYVAKRGDKWVLQPTRTSQSVLGELHNGIGLSLDTNDELWAEPIDNSKTVADSRKGHHRQSALRRANARPARENPPY